MSEYVDAQDAVYFEIDRLKLLRDSAVVGGGHELVFQGRIEERTEVWLRWEEVIPELEGLDRDIAAAVVELRLAEGVGSRFGWGRVACWCGGWGGLLGLLALGFGWGLGWWVVSGVLLLVGGGAGWWSVRVGRLGGVLVGEWRAEVELLREKRAGLLPEGG